MSTPRPSYRRLRGTVLLSRFGYCRGGTRPPDRGAAADEQKPEQKAKETPRKRVGAPPDAVDYCPAAVERAAKRGGTTAAADIKAGCPIILYYGKPWSVGKPLVDDGTALPVEIVGGCDAAAAFVAEVAAYNAAIRDWHARKKRPAPKG
jgi:hypothetical protein